MQLVPREFVRLDSKGGCIGFKLFWIESELATIVVQLFAKCLEIMIELEVGMDVPDDYFLAANLA